MTDDLLTTVREALEDAEARLKDISRLSNGESEEIYNRAYYGNQTRALQLLAHGCTSAAWNGEKVTGYPWRENHSFTPRGVNGLDKIMCARCGREARDQIHNGSLA